MEMIGYFAAAVMGITLGMVGAGGSIMIVPILVYLFHHSPLLATTESLFIVGITALVGSASYLKNKEIQIKAAFSFIVPSFVGVYLFRVVLLPLIPQTLLNVGGFVLTKSLFIMILFSILMLAASWSMIRKKPESGPALKVDSHQRMIRTAVAGFFVGGLTSLIGAGGGFLIIPSLVVLLELKMKEAVGTSLIIIASNSLFGFFSSYQQAEEVLNWSQMLSIAGLAVFGIFLGRILSKKVQDSTLKKGFGYFVLFMGAVILIDQIGNL